MSENFWSISVCLHPIPTESKIVLIEYDNTTYEPSFKFYVRYDLTKVLNCKIEG